MVLHHLRKQILHLRWISIVSPKKAKAVPTLIWYIIGQSWPLRRPVSRLSYVCHSGNQCCADQCCLCLGISDVSLSAAFISDSVFQEKKKRKKEKIHKCLCPVFWIKKQNKQKHILSSRPSISTACISFPETKNLPGFLLSLGIVHILCYQYCVPCLILKQWDLMCAAATVIVLFALMIYSAGDLISVQCACPFLKHCDRVCAAATGFVLFALQIYCAGDLLSVQCAMSFTKTLWPWCVLQQLDLCCLHWWYTVQVIWYQYNVPFLKHHDLVFAAATGFVLFALHTHCAGDLVSVQCAMSFTETVTLVCAAATGFVLCALQIYCAGVLLSLHCTMSFTETVMWCVLQQLEQDITSHQEKVQDVLDAAQVFKEAKHFMNKELQASARSVSERSVEIW